MMTRTPKEETTAVATSNAPTLLLAFELGDRTWKLGFTIRLWAAAADAGDSRPIDRSRAGGDRPREEAIPSARRVPVVSCYEAGRKGSGCTGGSSRRG